MKEFPELHLVSPVADTATSVQGGRRFVYNPIPALGDCGEAYNAHPTGVRDRSATARTGVLNASTGRFWHFGDMGLTQLTAESAAIALFTVRLPPLRTSPCGADVARPATGRPPLAVASAHADVVYVQVQNAVALATLATLTVITSDSATRPYLSRMESDQISRSSPDPDGRMAAVVRIART